ncbi:MAG: copper chaperone PCu(A)C [Nitrosomonadales bacterium]|nr:copper chaperone PCu(A)C [Nitrosomonadales bacterium]
MVNFSRLGGLFAALLISSNIYAGDIQIDDAWTRATAPGQDAAGVDITITSKQAATLLGFSSPIASSAEMHSMQDENGMMKMREAKSIALPAGKRFNFHDSGYHLMLIGLKEPLKEGSTIPLTLNIKIGQQGPLKIDVKAAVISLHAPKPAAQNSSHHHDH